MASSLISIFFRRNQKAGRRALDLGGRAGEREGERLRQSRIEKKRNGSDLGFFPCPIGGKRGGMGSIRFGGKSYSCLEYIYYEDRFSYHVTSMWGPVHAPVSIPRVEAE